MYNAHIQDEPKGVSTMTPESIARILSQYHPIAEDYPAHGYDGGIEGIAESYNPHDYELALREWHNMVEGFAHAIGRYPNFGRNAFMLACGYAEGVNAQ